MSISGFQLRIAKHALEKGEVVAYATDTVLGLGCDPENEAAIEKLLCIKNRAPDKGLILVAGNIEQLHPWVDFTQANNVQNILDSWPGSETWVLPAQIGVSSLITGDHRGIAVRVSASKTIQQLCGAFGGVFVSTSANRSGRPVAKTMMQCRKSFHSQVQCYLQSDEEQSQLPSRIRDGITGEVIRK